jgi:hypothetical protein
MVPMPCALPSALTAIRLPPGFRLVTLEAAATAARVHPRTLRGHCRAGTVWAWRIFNGEGPWRVVLDESGLPADRPGYVRPSMASAALPEGYRVTWLKDAADIALVNERTLRKHCTRGNVWAWRLFSGRGDWRVVVTDLDLPANPPSEARPLLATVVNAAPPAEAVL